MMCAMPASSGLLRREPVTGLKGSRSIQYGQTTFQKIILVASTREFIRGDREKLVIALEAWGPDFKTTLAFPHTMQESN